MSPKRNGMAEAPVDDAVVRTTTPPLGVLSLPPARTAFQDVILSKVTERMDINGLSQTIAEEVAIRLAGKVRVDTLIESVMQQEEPALTKMLMEHMLDRIAKGV